MENQKKARIRIHRLNQAGKIYCECGGRVLNGGKLNVWNESNHNHYSDSSSAEENSDVDHKKRHHKKSSKKAKKHKNKRKASSSESQSSDSDDSSSEEEVVKRKKQKKHKKSKRRHHHKDAENADDAHRARAHGHAHGHGRNHEGNPDEDSDVKISKEPDRVHYISSGEDEKGHHKRFKRTDVRRDEAGRFEEKPLKSKWDSPTEEHHDRRRWVSNFCSDDHSSFDWIEWTESNETHTNFVANEEKKPDVFIVEASRMHAELKLSLESILVKTKTS